VRAGQTQQGSVSGGAYTRVTPSSIDDLRWHCWQLDLFLLPGKLRACAEAPQRRPSPNASHPNFPPGLDGQLAKGPDTKAIDCENQKEVKVRRFETP